MQQQQVEEPPTIEGLQKTITRLQQYLDLFRQQRDNAMSAVSNLQADLAVANHQVKELEDQAKNLPSSSRMSSYTTLEEGSSN